MTQIRGHHWFLSVKNIRQSNLGSVRNINDIVDDEKGKWRIPIDRVCCDYVPVRQRVFAIVKIIVVVV